MAASAITCIYCKEVAARPPRGEHVILDALGGRTTIPDVCRGCNQRLGDTIDRQLMRNSAVTLLRFLRTPADRRPHDQPILYPRDDVGWMDAIVRGGDLLFPPQLYAVDSKLTLVASPTFDEQRAELMRMPIDSLTDARVHLHDGELAHPPRLVFSPALRRCFIRARTAAAHEEFVALLRSDLPRLRGRENQGIIQELTLPTDRLLKLTIAIGMNDAPRCATKMAFNFLSLFLGPEVALRPEFDGVRRYITGEDVLPPVERVAPDGERGLTIDTRYVANWMASPIEPHRWPALADSHYIVLLVHQRQLGAEVGLFGGRSRFLIRFADISEDFPSLPPLPAVFVTPTDDTGDRIVERDHLVSLSPYVLAQ
jgi:hypothetical protein